MVQFPSPSHFDGSWFSRSKWVVNDFSWVSLWLSPVMMTGTIPRSFPTEPRLWVLMSSDDLSLDDEDSELGTYDRSLWTVPVLSVGNRCWLYHVLTGEGRSGRMRLTCRTVKCVNTRNGPGTSVVSGISVIKYYTSKDLNFSNVSISLIIVE